jgi:hypothetical protein
VVKGVGGMAGRGKIAMHGPMPHRVPGCTRRLAQQSLARLVAGVMVLVTGCGPQEIRSSTPVDPTTDRLLALGAAYAQFTFDRSRPPRGPEDLRDLLPAPDALTSPRDSEPFVVFWGVDLRGPQKWATGRPILAHERTGAGGSRFVLSTMRNVEQLDEAAFRASSFPPQRAEK